MSELPYVLLESNSTQKLSELVSEYIDKGYTPYGSPIAATCSVFQAVIKISSINITYSPVI